MYHSTFAHLRDDYAPPTAVPRPSATRRRRLSARTLRPLFARRRSARTECGAAGA